MRVRVQVTAEIPDHLAETAGKEWIRQWMAFQLEATGSIRNSGTELDSGPGAYIGSVEIVEWSKDVTP